jgi:chromosome partitioning protein
VPATRSGLRKLGRVISCRDSILASSCGDRVFVYTALRLDKKAYIGLSNRAGIGMVLTISSRKGGCGKTVLAMTLVASLAEDGADVALLDTDPNHAAHRWVTETRRPPIQAYAEADAERLAELLPTLAERHELLIIDTAGFGNQAAMVAAAGADLVLVPVTPGEGDLVEAQRTVSYVEGLGRSTRRAIPVRVLANRIRRATTLSRHVLAQLEALGLPRVQTVLSEAVTYGEISFSGVLPTDGTSATEIAALMAELREGAWLPNLRQGINLDIREGVKV